LVTKVNGDDTITKTLTHGEENDMKFGMELDCCLPLRSTER